MDLLLMMAACAACVISIMIACRNPKAGLLTNVFGWVAGAYLCVLFVLFGSQTTAYSIIEWTGQAETGPVTLLVMVISMACPFVVGWEMPAHGS